MLSKAQNPQCNIQSLVLSLQNKLNYLVFRYDLYRMYTSCLLKLCQFYGFLESSLQSPTLPCCIALCGYIPKIGSRIIFLKFTY